MIPRKLPFLAALLLVAPSTYALDPTREVSQYGHSAWTLQDGVLPGAPTAMAQTADGYLWIGTRGGLVRFDGVRFVPLTPPEGEKLRSTRILALEAGRDGSLWIGTRSSLERWHQGHLKQYETPRSQISSIIEDRAGRIWFTRMSVADEEGPLCEIQDEKVICHGVADGVSIPIGRQLMLDPDGAFWTLSDDTLMRWHEGASRTWLPPGITRENKTPDVIHSLERTRDGTVWVGATLPSRGLGLLRLVDDELQPYVTPQLDGRKLSVSPILEDRDGALWIGTQDDGVYRLHEGRVSHYGSAQGLSSDTVQEIFEDREGTVWVMTTRGLDAFRDVRIASVTSREGLSADLANSVLATRDGAVWINTWHWLDVLRDGKITSLSAGKGFPGEEVLSMYEDRDGAIWMGIDNGLFVYEAGRFKPIRRPDGSPAGFMRGITQDIDGDMWTMTGSFGPGATLMRIRGRRIVEEVPNIPFQHRTIVPDPRGGVWFPLTNGDVARYHAGRLETVEFHREPGTGIVNALLAYPDGSIVGSSPIGLIGVRNGKPQTMAEPNGMPCTEIHALARGPSRRTLALRLVRHRLHRCRSGAGVVERRASRAEVPRVRCARRSTARARQLSSECIGRAGRPLVVREREHRPGDRSRKPGRQHARAAGAHRAADRRPHHSSGSRGPAPPAAHARPADRLHGAEHGDSAPGAVPLQTRRA